MKRLALLTTLALPLLACGNADSTDTNYSASELSRYKAALPSASQLTAATPAASAVRATATSDFPQMAKSAVKDINGVVAGIIDLMRAIVELTPTVYNSDTHEFVWGPWNNDNDFGQVAVYIKEQLPLTKPATGCPSGYAEKPAGTCTPDFHFVYALARGVGNDMATYTPVIWGGANPDATNPDFGTGVTLWDFEANYTFAVANDPGYATKDFARGRFVALYGKGASTNANDPAGSTFAFNVAVFSKFVPQDKPNIAGIDAEYFYGFYKGAFQLGFVNFHTQSDVDHDASGDPEDLTVRIAYLPDTGVGRAEADIACPTGTTCSLPGPTSSVGHATECWDASLGKLYANLTYNTWSLTTPVGATPADCGAPFQNTLTDLNVPSLSGIDPALMAILHSVADHGMPKGT